MLGDAVQTLSAHKRGVKPNGHWAVRPVVGVAAKRLGSSSGLGSRGPAAALLSSFATVTPSTLFGVLCLVSVIVRSGIRVVIRVDGLPIFAPVDNLALLGTSALVPERSSLRSLCSQLRGHRSLCRARLKVRHATVVEADEGHAARRANLDEKWCATNVHGAGVAGRALELESGSRVTLAAAVGGHTSEGRPEVIDCGLRHNVWGLPARILDLGVGFQDAYANCTRSQALEVQLEPRPSRSGQGISEGRACNARLLVNQPRVRHHGQALSFGRRELAKVLAKTRLFAGAELVAIHGGGQRRVGQ